MEDLDRPLGAHDRHLGAGPGQAHVVAHGLGVHDDVGAAVGLAQDEAHAGHRRLGVGEDQLGAVADHAPPLEVLAGHETGRVHQGDDGQVEGIAEGDETGPLLGGRDVQGARHGQGLVGHHADGLAVDAGQGGDQLGGPTGPQLQQLPVVGQGRDDAADVVGARGPVGKDRRAAPAWPGRRGRRGARARRCRRRGRAGSRALAPRASTASASVATTSAATPVERAWTALPAELGGAQAQAGHLGHHGRARQVGQGVACS